MTPRSLAKWGVGLKNFQQTLPQRGKTHVSHFSTIRLQVKGLSRSSLNHQHQNNSNIVQSPFPKLDIPQILIPELIWDTVDKFPEAPALKCGVTGRAFKYAEIQKLSRRFMNSLIKSGFSNGDVVALILPNCPEFPIITLGAIEAELVVSLINHVYTPDEICHQLKDSGCVCVVSGVDQLSVVQAAITKLEQATQSKPIRKVIAVDIPSPESLPEGVARFSEMVADHVDHLKYNSSNRKPNDMVFLPYSSGTTGLAKGVCLSHSNIVSNIYQMSAGGLDICTPDKGHDILLGLLPFFHIYGLVVILLNSLKHGSQTITLPKFEPESFTRTFENEKLTVLFLVPPLVLFLGNHPSIDTKKHLAHVKHILSGAAPLGDTDMERLRARLPKNDCILSQGYGMTELSPVATIPIHPVKNLATCGAPVANSQGKIICLDTGKALGPNQSGELCFRGPHVMLGYHNNTKATAEMIDAEGWLHTGDIGYYDEDSHFYVEDRLKELIKVKGFQVPPAELEAILRTHPEVTDVGVIGVPDPHLGEAPVAFVVRAKENNITEEPIKEFLSKKVAKHKQLSKVIFVDSIPKSASGKILRKDLRQIYKNYQN